MKLEQKEKTVYKEYIAHGSHKSKFRACIPDTQNCSSMYNWSFNFIIDPFSGTSLSKLTKDSMFAVSPEETILQVAFFYVDAYECF